MSILIYYQTYKDYIAANLCENRYKPDSKCNGQCYLMKKLRQAEKQDQTPVVPDNQKLEFIQVETVTVYFEDLITKAVRRPQIPSLHPIEYRKSIFHPPIFFS